MKTPEEIAREIVDRKTIDPGFVGPGDVSCPKGGLIAAIAAAISAERSAGLSDGGKDRKATPKLSAKPAPACARCGGSGRDSRAECRPVFDAASSRWVPEVIPCPECRGTP